MPVVKQVSIGDQSERMSDICGGINQKNVGRNCIISAFHKISRSKLVVQSVFLYSLSILSCMYLIAKNANCIIIILHSARFFNFPFGLLANLAVPLLLSS